MKQTFTYFITQNNTHILLQCSLEHFSTVFPFSLLNTPSVLRCLLQFPRRNVEMLNFRTSFMGIRYRTTEITLQVKMALAVKFFKYQKRDLEENLILTLG